MTLTKRQKNNFACTMLFIATFIFAFLVMRNIPLLGDDYYYTTFWNNDFWHMHKEHYMLINGRAIVHLLVTVFLSIHPIFWQILNSFLLALIATFAARHFASGKAALITVLIALGMILSLEAIVVNQCIYWLTGSFNYVYPFALLMVYWYLLCNISEKKIPYLYILAFLSAATTEQNGMMTLGVTVLYVLDVILIKKEKISLRRLCILIPTIIGFCSVYFAPAIFIRFGLETEKSMIEGICEQLPILYYTFISSKYMLPFIGFNFVSMGIFMFKNYRKLWFKLIAILNFAAIYVSYSLSEGLHTHMEKAALIAVLFITVLLVIDIACIFTWLIKNKADGYFVICTAFILAVGSQVMTTVSPVWGPRTMLCGIFNIMIFDMGLIALVCNEKKYYALSVIISLIFCLSGVKIYSNTYIGYKTNYIVAGQNAELIENYKENPSGELALYKMPYAEHCWSMPYVSPYHLHYYKKYYGLSEETNINWMEYDLKSK